MRNFLNHILAGHVNQKYYPVGKDSGPCVEPNAMYISKENGCRTSPETKFAVKPTCNPIGQKSATDSFIVLIISAGIGCQPHPIKISLFLNISKVEVNSANASQKLTKSSKKGAKILARDTNCPLDLQAT